MKKLIFIITSFLTINTYAEQINIWPHIFISKSADLDQIDEILSTTRDEVRSRLIDDVERLVQYGEPAEVAAAVVAEFDSYYQRHRNQAFSGLGKHLGNSLISTLDQAHRSFDIKNRKLYFMSKSNASSLLMQVNRRVNIESANNYDVILYGNYAVHGNNRYGQAIITLIVHGFNKKTGIINSFKASGLISSVSQSIITQMFDVYYREKLPVVVPGEGVRVVYHDFNSHLGRKSAERKCRQFRGRLLKREEMEAVELIGSYNGVLNLKRPAIYYLYSQRLDDTYGLNYQYDRLKLGNHFLSARNPQELNQLIQNNVYSLAHNAPRAVVCVQEI